MQPPVQALHERIFIYVSSQGIPRRAKPGISAQFSETASWMLLRNQVSQTPTTTPKYFLAKGCSPQNTGNRILLEKNRFLFLLFYCYCFPHFPVRIISLRHLRLFKCADTNIISCVHETFYGKIICICVYCGSSGTFMFFCVLYCIWISGKLFPIHVTVAVLEAGDFRVFTENRLRIYSDKNFFTSFL